MGRGNQFTRQVILHGNAFADITKIITATNVVNHNLFFDGITTTFGSVIEAAAGNGVIIVDAGEGEVFTASGLGIAKHNMNLTGSSIVAAYSDDNASYTDFITIDTTELDNDGPFFKEASEEAHRYWRLTFTVPNSVDLFIGYIALGVATELPMGVSSGFANPIFNDKDVVNSNKTISGNFAGVNVKINGNTASIPVRFMNQDFVINKAKPLLADLKLLPIFYLWDSLSVDNNKDFFFGVNNGRMPVPTFSGNRFSSMTIQATGLVSRLDTSAISTPELQYVEFEVVAP